MKLIVTFILGLALVYASPIKAQETGTIYGTVVDRQNPVTTADEVIVARRKWQVPYWDISGVNVDDVRNENKEVDGRTALSDRPFVDDINVDKVEAGIIVL